MLVLLLWVASFCEVPPKFRYLGFSKLPGVSDSQMVALVGPEHSHDQGLIHNPSGFVLKTTIVYVCNALQSMHFRHPLRAGSLLPQHRTTSSPDSSFHSKGYTYSLSGLYIGLDSTTLSLTPPIYMGSVLRALTAGNKNRSIGEIYFG